jgi:hypothetical protein
MDRTGDGSPLGPLLGFAQIDQEHLAVLQFGGYLLRRQVLDAVLGLGDELGRGLGLGLHGRRTEVPWIYTVWPSVARLALSGAVPREAA